MRFEINIPDSTRPELQAMMMTLTRRLSEEPELVGKLYLSEGEDAEIQSMFTPERLARIAKADAEIESGQGLTPEQVDERLVANRKAWLAANQA